MIGPADVIANGLRCPGAKEDRACVGDLFGQRRRVRDAEFEVFGGYPVGKLRGHSQIGHGDHRAKVAPAGTGDGPTFQRLQAFFDSRHNGGPKGGVVQFHMDKFANPAGLVEYIEGQNGFAKIKDNKLIIRRDWAKAKDRVNGAFAIARDLAAKAESAPAKKG